ncbi:MAG: excinuclease ABC subunit UvrA [Flavobacteriales bacterium]|nr:excinuclease ABC subunit UvrA [Flavobacteriales bacterium]
MHNLKNIDVSIPRNAFTVVTGVSGSGKSSLVFDTLYAEGQRRYVESLSAYARQFLGRLDKPDVDSIDGLTPCVAIEQKVNTRNPRSTVATSTEIYDYLKLLFARLGRTISPVSGNEVKAHNTADVVDFFSEQGKRLPASRAYLITEITIHERKALTELLELEMKKGFSRLWYEGEMLAIEEGIARAAELSKRGTVYLLIDRYRLSDSYTEQDLQRMADSVETAYFEGKGELHVLIEEEDGTISSHIFNNRFELDGMSFERPTVNFLSFNNPFGACRKCQGFGSIIGIDEDLVVPDKGLSVDQGAIAPWRSDSFSKWRDAFFTGAKRMGFPLSKPYYELSRSEKVLLWEGNAEVEGVDAFFQYLEQNTYKIQYRVLLSKYRGKTICPECKGTRLRRDAAYVRLIPTHSVALEDREIKDISLPEVLLMNVGEASLLFDQLKFSEKETAVGDRILKEIRNRLHFLRDVGLEYLELNRLSNTLSGGESQRINLATSLGSSLVGSTYILDEPSIGLHSRDTERLINVLKGLRDQGNTVVVVEHDEDVMQASDQLIDVGPFAGRLGGEIVYNGPFASISGSGSLTAKYLIGAETISIPTRRRKWNNYIGIRSARHNNLKGVEVKIPLGCITAVTGVSGSGKTSLIKGILFPALQRQLEQFTGIKVGDNGGLYGDLRSIQAVELVDQNPIGKSSRSNPVTYVKAYDAIRDLFAAQPLSKQRGYAGSHFSFNVEGGRCDNCKGEGEEIVEMQFMADLHLPCEVCGGKRFKDEILEVTFKQKSIHDVLSLTVDEAMEFFEGQPIIRKRLKPLQDVGLGYLSLGQSSNTLSGGEAQRIKLASFLGKSVAGVHTLFIFDEPTTGLHFHDVRKLLKSFNALVEKGNSVLTIEHNLDVVKSADWVIDLGPEGGEKGGYVLFEGTPEAMLEARDSYTAEYLRPKFPVAKGAAE